MASGALHSAQHFRLDYQHKIVVGDISLSFLKNTTQESLQNFGEQNQKSHYRLAPEIFKDGFFTEKSDVVSCYSLKLSNVLNVIET